MPRFYTISCQGVSATAVQDVLGAYAGTSRKLLIHAFEIGANGQTTVGNYRLRLRRVPATVTSGSGGSAATPRPADPNDAAATFTARANDTTQATSTGTIVDLWSNEFNPINGTWWQVPFRDAAFLIDLSQACVLSLDSISGTLNLNASMLIEEL